MPTPRTHHYHYCITISLCILQTPTKVYTSCLSSHPFICLSSCSPLFLLSSLPLLLSSCVPLFLRSSLPALLSSSSLPALLSSCAPLFLLSSPPLFLLSSCSLPHLSLFL